MKEQTESSRSLDRNSLLIILIVAAVSIPTVLGLAFAERVSGNPWQAAGIVFLYEVLILALGFIVQVGHKTGRRWSERLVNRLDGQLMALFSPFRQEYFQHLVYRHRMFNVKGLATQGVYTLELNQVFVELSVAPQVLHQVSADPLRRVVGPLRQNGHVIWDYLASDKLAHQNLAVTGPPGSGKTTLLKHVALALCTHQHPLRIRHKLPVLLFLRDQAAAIAKVDAYTLVDAVEDALAQWSLTPPAGWFQDQLRRGRCLVMLDGLDEIADVDLRERVAEWVERQIVVYHHNRFIVTSRPHGFRSNPLSGVSLLEVRPFNSEQIERFVHNWYTANEIMSMQKDDPGVRMAAQEGAQDLMRRLRSVPALSDLAVNPLLLTMIATVHRYRSSLPGRRVELYSEISEVFLGKRHQARGLTLDLTPAQKQRVLQPLAYHMMERKKQEVSRAEAVRVIAEPLTMVDPYRAVTKPDPAGNIRGLPPRLYHQVRVALLTCGPMGSDRELRAVFADARLYPWRYQMPTAATPNQRAEALIDLLYEQRNEEQENALLLFLQVLLDRIEPGDGCHEQVALLMNQIRQVPGAVHAQPDQADPTVAADFLKMIENSSGLLLERENGTYGFAHLTFQEYLAANHVRDQMLEDRLVGHVNDSWWHETIRLYAAQADGTPIIAACLAEDKPAVSTLALAIQCLEEAREVRPAVRVQLERVLEEDIEDEDAERRRIVAKALLALRLNRLLRVGDDTYVDISYIPHAIYQLFLDEKRAQNEHYQPDHWTAYHFPAGQGDKPVVGVRPSDARAFCQWLTRREVSGWVYRFPRAEELISYKLAYSTDVVEGIGYWVAADDDLMLAINSEPRTELSRLILEQRLWRDLAQILDHTHNLARTLDLFEKADLSGALDLDCVLDASLDLVDILDLEVGVFLDLEDALDFARSVAHRLDLEFANSLDITRARAIIGARPLDFARALDLARRQALDFVRNRTLDREYAQRVRIFIRLYALRIARDLSDALQQWQTGQSWARRWRQSRELKAQVATVQTLLDRYLDLHVDVVILEERIEGNLPAYEGIRIVKERLAKEKDGEWSAVKRY